MRVITFNANGIRSAARRGFFTWLQKQDADIVCLQEIKAAQDQLTSEPYYPEGYQCFYHPAQRKGYSGVGLYVRVQPKQVGRSFGSEQCDEEGRYLCAQWGSLQVISVYFPSGTSGDARQEVKYVFMDAFAKHLEDLKADGRPCIICGDWNIAHRKIDLKNWASNQRNSGFLPAERGWMEEILTKRGYQDAFRLLHPNASVYTWWTYRANARQNNVGWRIDYQIVSESLSPYIRRAFVYNEEVFSDHAPLIVEYDLEMGE